MWACIYMTYICKKYIRVTLYIQISDFAMQSGKNPTQLRLKDYAI